MTPFAGPLYLLFMAFPGTPVHALFARPFFIDLGSSASNSSFGCDPPRLAEESKPSPPRKVKKASPGESLGSLRSIMCRWTRPFWGTDCQRSRKGLSSAQAASLCSAGIERAQECLQGEHFVRGSPGGSAVCDPNPPRPFARYRSEGPDRPPKKNQRRVSWRLCKSKIVCSFTPRLIFGVGQDPRSVLVVSSDSYTWCLSRERRVRVVSHLPCKIKT